MGACNKYKVKVKTIEKFGEDICEVCERLSKHLEKQAKIFNKLNRKDKAKFYFYRGKLMAYLYDLGELSIIEGSCDWFEIYQKCQLKLKKADIKSKNLFLGGD